MHTMSIIREHEGTEEWHCPTCGRHMIVNWSPKFKRTIVQTGDLSVSHNGFRNGLQIGRGAAASDSAVERPIDEARLMTWEMWLDETGFNDLWDTDVQ